MRLSDARARIHQRIHQRPPMLYETCPSCCAPVKRSDAKPVHRNAETGELRYEVQCSCGTTVWMNRRGGVTSFRASRPLRVSTKEQQPS